MPTYEITSPDGRKFRVTAPAGASQDEVMRYAMQNMPMAPPATPQEKFDPTGSFAENLAAGFGKSIVDTGRMVKQLGSYVGIGDKAAIQQEIDDAKKRDAPLMSSGGGVTGNIAGQISQFLLPGGALKAAGAATKVPALVGAGQAILAPQTIPGAAAVGAAQGFFQPVASDDSRIGNMTMGAAGGAALPVAVAVGKFAHTAAMPFSKKGQETLAGRTIERFATNPGKVEMAQADQLVPGSIPMLADAAQDVGISQLHRQLRNNPDANALITQRALSNQEARLNALRGIAGDPGQREFFDDSRRTAAKELYDKAMAEIPTTTPWIKGQLTQLQKRPAFNAALADAQKLAAEEGLTLDPKNVTQVLHYTKLALDDLISKATPRSNEQRALMGTKQKLVSMLESKDFAPSYREARDTFSQMSKPINQMDLGQALLEKLQPALAEFGAVSRTRPQAYAQAVRNIDQTAKAATGFRGAKAENILTPEQMGTVQNIARDLGRAANAEEMGMAKGSPTLQNMVGQNLLESVLGPFGIPKSLGNTAFAESLLRPVAFAYKAPEARVLAKLGDAAIDTKEAQRLLALARKRGLLGGYADDLLPYTTSAGAAGLLNFRQ